MVHYEKGNMLFSDCDYLCHQVNCQGKMGSGIALAIKDKWPIVYEQYKEWYEWWQDVAADQFMVYENGPDGSELMLGHILTVKVNGKQSIINLAAQQYYGFDDRRYTSYEAFWNCLDEIKNSVPKGSTIAFPEKIGSNRGGANWNVIKAMIEAALGDDYDVYIYSL